MKESIARAWELYESISTWTDKISAIQVDTGIRKEPVSWWFHECQDRLEPLLKDEATQFLAVPVIESYFRRLLPAITIPATELLTDESPKLAEVQELQTILEKNPAKAIWKERTEAFKDIAKQIGYEFDNDRYEDLAAIAPIIANALTVFRGKYRDTQVLQVRKGTKSNAKPLLLNDIAVFRTEAEAVQVLEKLPVQSFIGFVGVQPTYGDTNDDCDDWTRKLNNLPLNERKRNIMHHENLTEEQHDQTADMHATRLYAVIRDGENIWLFVPPFEVDTYGNLYRDGFINYYGRRSTYAPVQVFFNNAPDKSEGVLIVRNNNVWSLINIIDEEQKIWLPIFLSTVQSYFFGDTEPEAEMAYLREETRVVPACLETSAEKELVPQPRNTIVVQPVNKFFARRTAVSPRNSSRHEYDKKYANAPVLLSWLGITEQDIADLPYKIDTIMTPENSQKRIEEDTVEAYYALIENRLGKVWLDKAYDAQRWYHKYIDGHLEQILKEAEEGLFNSVNITIDKNPIFNEDGTPKMVHGRRWGEMVQGCDRTDIDEGKIPEGKRHDGANGRKRTYEYRAWIPETLVNKHPPVVVYIHPETPEDVAQICHCRVEDLPDAIRYMNIVPMYMAGWLPYDIRHAGDFDIRIILSKPEFKKRFGTKHFRK